MKKRDLLIKYNELLEEKGMSKIQLLYESVGVNSTKAEIESAINCLLESDDEMLKRLEQFKDIYPAIYKAILETGNFLTHSFNRYYVYTMTNLMRGEWIMLMEKTNGWIFILKDYMSFFFYVQWKFQWTIRGQSVNEPTEFPLINRMNIFCFCIFMLKNVQNSTVFQTASNHYKIIWFDCFWWKCPPDIPPDIPPDFLWNVLDHTVTVTVTIYNILV